LLLQLKTGILNNPYLPLGLPYYVAVIGVYGYSYSVTVWPVRHPEEYLYKSMVHNQHHGCNHLGETELN